jgi:glycine dehydrogenase subunit 2
MTAPLLFELSAPGCCATPAPPCDVPERHAAQLVPPALLADRDLDLPEVSEIDLVRHYTHLAQRNWSVDGTFYPLGSCTMKYNPKRNERLAARPGFSQVHPLAGENQSQGMLRLMWELQRMLGEIAGLPHVTLQPAAGAHGELTSLLMIAAYHRHHEAEHAPASAEGQGGVPRIVGHSAGGPENGGRPQRKDIKGSDPILPPPGRAAAVVSQPCSRTTVLIPDSAHGTNPASAHIAGFQPRTVASDPRGNVDLKDLAAKLDRTVAALMITNPNTLGLFDEHLRQVVDAVHAAGALVYLDGANMNALLGVARPGDFGVDIMHFNTHKTFSTPHGSGGPGAGPVACSEALAPFLPTPVVVERAGEYQLDQDRPLSIGRVHAFHGNVGVLVRAYAYLRTLGAAGLRRATEHALLNANYVLARLRGHYHVPYDRPCMHECVLSAGRQAAKGVHALDIAKRLIDYGFHPPTIYFPLIVPEALMIEPTETESKRTLDAFIAAMVKIAEEAETDPQAAAEAPATTDICRPDEVAAARKPNVRWRPIE